MSYTGFRTLDNVAHKASEWIGELDDIYGWEDKQKSYQAFRAVAHTIRDRLTAEESAQLAAQLPMMLRGMYFDGWSPSGKPEKWRSQNEFIERLMDAYGGPDELNPEAMATGAFEMLDRRVSEGEISEVKSMLPKSVRQMWP